MADLSLQERMQPSLLDRLTDKAPEQTREAASQRSLTLPKLRQSVLRDLSWLFNAGNLGQRLLAKTHPEVARSVVNYGIPEFAGLCGAAVDADEVVQTVRQAVWDFEPRIRRETLQVRLLPGSETSAQSTLTFEIAGELWAQPVPLELVVRTNVDLETGVVQVVEHYG